MFRSTCTRMIVGGVALLMASVPAARAQQCPLNSHFDRIDDGDDVETIHCKCDAGYELRGGRCTRIAATASAAKTRAVAKMEMAISDQRGAAIRGDYEDRLDEAIRTYGGYRTKQVIEESERIRHGGGQGSGHDGDTAQPGLTGREGMR